MCIKNHGDVSPPPALTAYLEFILPQPKRGLNEWMVALRKCKGRVTVTDHAVDQLRKRSHLKGVKYIPKLHLKQYVVDCISRGAYWRSFIGHNTPSLDILDPETGIVLRLAINEDQGRLFVVTVFRKDTAHKNLYKR